MLQSREHGNGSEENMVLKNGIGLRVDDQRAQRLPVRVEVKEAGYLLSIHQARRKLLVGSGGDGGVPSNDPHVLLELSARRKSVGESIELVSVRRIEIDEAFKIWAGHDDRRHDVGLLGSNGIGIVGQVGHFELTNELGQHSPLTQGPAEKLQSYAGFHLELFELRRGILSHDMDSVVQLVANHSIPCSAGQGKVTQVPHVARIAAMGRGRQMDHLQLLKYGFVDSDGQFLRNRWRDSESRALWSGEEGTFVVAGFVEAIGAGSCGKIGKIGKARGKAFQRRSHRGWPRARICVARVEDIVRGKGKGPLWSPCAQIGVVYLAGVAINQLV